METNVYVRMAPATATMPPGVPQAAGNAACQLCEQLAQAGARYFTRLRSDKRMRRGLADSLASSMGLCMHHEQLLRGDPELHAWIDGCIADARGRLAALFVRARLQDELLQDILFGARHRCPVCVYFRRVAGGWISCKLHEAQSRSLSVATLIADQLCFEHARELTRRAQGALRSRLSRALRRKGAHLLSLAALDEPGAGAITRHAGWAAEALPQPGKGSPDAVQGADPIPMARSPCPVCGELEAARLAWLRVVSDTIRLEQPAWLALPTCAEHLAMSLPRENAAGRAVIMRAYIESALAPRRHLKAAAAAKRRRDPLRWFDSRRQAGQTAGAQAGAGDEPAAENSDPPLENLSCPGCQASDIAARTAVSRWLHGFERATPARARDLTAHLCLKHLAEVLIYESQAQLRTRIVASLLKGSLIAGEPTGHSRADCLSTACHSRDPVAECSDSGRPQWKISTSAPTTQQ